MPATAKKGKSGINRNKPVKKRGHYIVFTERMKMIEQYMTGGADNGIRNIAIRFNRDAAAVSSIVEGPEA